MSTTPAHAAAAAAVILFAHGSRDPAWKKPVEQVAQVIRQRAPGTPVACAYLELTEPDLPTAAAALLAGTDAQPAPAVLRIFPLFLGVGRHAREDLPELVQALRARWPQVQIDLMPSAGEHAAVIELLAGLALGEAWGSVPG